MDRVDSFRDLIVWKKAMLLVKEVYQVTKNFPADERFGLVAQMRRASVSVPSNIAEGQARRSTKEFIHFLSQAQGSLAELETQMLISYELGFQKAEEGAIAFGYLTEVRNMLRSLRYKLSQK